MNSKNLVREGGEAEMRSPRLPPGRSVGHYWSKSMVADAVVRIKIPTHLSRPGPQPLNQIGGTADEQIARARQPRPRPSVGDRVAILERRVADLARQFARAGVPA